MRILFEEKQRFTQWWLWAVLIFVALMVAGTFINALYMQLVMGQPWGDMPLSNEGLIAVTLMMISSMIVMIVITFSSVLEVKVDKMGVSYTFFPLIRRERRIQREDIKSFEVKKFFITNYGLHYNITGDKRINMKGNISIAITTNNGKRLTLGTQKPDEFFHALDVMKKGSDDQ